MGFRDSETPDPLIGKQVGNTVVIQKIGQGGIATVYQAMETGDANRLVALKVIHRTEQRLLRADGATQNPFALEHRVSKAAQHPGVIRIYDTGNTPDGRYYAAMEYISGVTLDQELRHRGHLAWPEALEVLTQLASACGALHGAAIIHRDLKPGNVMVYDGTDGRPHVKLIDLGLCRLDHEKDGARAGVLPGSVGTPAYMAPEVAVGAGTSKQSDVYALGAILYEILTGKPVIALKRPDTEQFLAYLRSQQEIPAVPPERLVQDLPLPIIALVRQLCARNPRERPRDAAVVQATIERLTATLPPPAPEKKPGGLRRALSSLFGKRDASVKQGRFRAR
jgi:serine/threonine protein kinase